MTHGYLSRFTLLLFLALTALAGCDPTPPPPPEPTYSEVQFEVTVPPETPVGGTLYVKGSDPALSNDNGRGVELVYQGGHLFSAKARVIKDQAFTYSVHTVLPAAQVELDAAGAVVPERSHTAREDAENLTLTVERWGPASGAGTAPQTVFVVAVPSNTPANDSIWLSGNHALLGSWNGAGVRLYKAVNGRHAARLSFPPGTSLEYKATRGSWATVEKGSAGEEIDNHTLKTGGGFERTFLTVAKWNDLEGVPPAQVLTGHIEYLRGVTPTNTALKKRDVIIWLPPDYKSNSTRHYPVLYMHDGQNLMDATTSFVGEWSVDETAQQLVESGQVEPVIIVGVYNAGTDRIAEYTQVPDPKYAQQGGDRGGKADEYGAFLVNDLKPLIDGKYRTKPEAQYTGLAGSSLGGLVSMYLGMKHPGTFTRLGVISPSVFWGEKDIVSRVNALPGKLPLRIWEDMGTDEASTDSPETVADARLLRDALVGKGWVVDSDLKYTEIPGGKHNEKAWAARFGDILKYLYPPAQ
jgi:predicted alpha/beta superfamily hydrolase